jgi:hypothetical protein
LANEIDASALLDYVLSARMRGNRTKFSAPLALLPLADEVVAMVPARHLSRHQVTLPKGVLPRGRWQDSGTCPTSRVEGLLEDQLLNRTQLHLLLMPGARADAPVWVVVYTVLRRRGRRGAGVSPNQPDRPSSPLARWGHLVRDGTPEQAQLVLTARGGVIGAALSASVAWLTGRQAVWLNPPCWVWLSSYFRHSDLAPGAQRSS